MSNSNRFTLDYTTWDLTADGTTIGNVGPVLKFGMTELQDEIDNAVGGELELLGKIYAPTLAEIQAAGSAAALSVRNTSGSALTVNNGTFFGGLGLTFSGAGVVKEASLASLYGVSWVDPDGTSKIHDADATGKQPFLAVWPTPPEGMKHTPQTSNANWLGVGTVYANVPGFPPGESQDSTTWPWIDNGTTYAGNVTGFQLVDAQDIIDFEAAYNAAADTDAWVMLYLSANNIVSETTFTYDAGTKTVTFTSAGLTYAGYVKFAMTGDPGLIVEDGQYVIETVQEKVFYRPYPESSLNEVFYPVPYWLWDDAVVPATSFDGTAWYCGGSDYLYRAEGITSGSTVLNDCTFQTTNGSHVGCIDLPITVTGCSFDNSTGRGIAASEGSTIQRSRFTGTAKSSGVLIQGLTATQSPGGTAVAHSLIEDNYFSIAEANHGQGCSLYQGAWMNATVQHNLFMNCQRAFSHQGFGPNGGVILRATGGTFKFENNLVIHDYAPDEVPSGQATVSFNTSSHPSGVIYDQDILIRNNTVVHDIDDVGLSVQTNSYTMDYYLNRYGDNLQFTNNMVGKWTTTKETVSGLTGPLSPANSIGNIATIGGFNQSAGGATDVLVGTDAGWSGDQGDYFIMDTLSVTGGAETHASDGGKVGFRWANNITLAVASDPPVDWYTQYPAEAIPEPAGLPFWGQS